MECDTHTRLYKNLHRDHILTLLELADAWPESNIYAETFPMVQSFLDNL